MKKSIFALFSILVFAISCKKDDPAPAVPVADKPYYNINTGTNWVYEVKTQDPTTLDTTSVNDTARVTGVDTLIDGKTYALVSHTNGNTTSYFNVTGNDYYQFQNVAALDTSIIALYLKDNSPVGTSWVENLTLNAMGITVPITITYSITGKGDSKTVKGITYNDVITVQTVLNSSGLPAGSIVSDIKNYYTRDIGLIQGDYNIDVALAGISVHSQTLLAFADPH